MTERSKQDPQKRVVVFGEVLFDLFPDGEAVLGGAPFNVAWNLAGLGLSPILVSRIGADERGERVLEAMRAWGMETAGVQRDAERPTGVVRVTLRDGQPEFEIPPDQAWDALDAEAAVAALGGRPAGLLYHGTLAARSPGSRAALAALRRSTPLSRFVDVNLRAPWWELAVVRRAVAGAETVKLNEDELRRLAPADAGHGDLEALGAAVRGATGCERLVVTLGERGAIVFASDEQIAGRPEGPVTLADTVGAGDALSAVTILGLVRGWEMQRTVPRAVDFAAAVCGLRGATASDASFYAAWRERWRREDG